MTNLTVNTLIVAGLLMLVGVIMAFREAYRDERRRFNERRRAENHLTLDQLQFVLDQLRYHTDGKCSFEEALQRISDGGINLTMEVDGKHVTLQQALGLKKNDGRAKDSA